MSNEKSVNVLVSHFKAENTIWSHYSSSVWKQCNDYCPNCGKQTCWEDTGFPDLEIGAEYICTSCEYSFHLPCSDKISKHEKDATRQVVALLKLEEKNSEN